MPRTTKRRGYPWRVAAAVKPRVKGVGDRGPHEEDRKCPPKGPPAVVRLRCGHDPTTSLCPSVTRPQSGIITQHLRCSAQH